MSYVLTPDAAEDLEEIWRVSFERWGADQADKYLARMEQCLTSICQGEAYCRAYPEIDPRLNSHHCEHHYIFFLDAVDTVTVVAVMFERMNLLVRLKQRLR